MQVMAWDSLGRGLPLILARRALSAASVPRSEELMIKRKARQKRKASHLVQPVHSASQLEEHQALQLVLSASQPSLPLQMTKTHPLD